MKKLCLLFSCSIVIMTFLSCNTKSENSLEQISKYVPSDINLHNEIVALDKEYFDAYNTCDLEKQASMYSDKIEFFHDIGGLMTSKKDLLEALEKNICGKVTRELIAESIEVYPIHDYGAVQIGFHKFHNIQEPNAKSIPSKFITVWKNDIGKWQMEKVFSFHKN